MQYNIIIMAYMYTLLQNRLEMTKACTGICLLTINPFKPEFTLSSSSTTRRKLLSSSQLVVDEDDLMSFRN